MLRIASRSADPKNRRRLGLVVLLLLGSLLLNACARSDALSYVRVDEAEGAGGDDATAEDGLLALPGLVGPGATDPAEGAGAEGAEPVDPGAEGAQPGQDPTSTPEAGGAGIVPVEPGGGTAEVAPGFETSGGTPYAVPPQQSGGQQFQPVFAEVSMDGGMFDQQTLLMMTTLGVAKLRPIAGKQVYLIDMTSIPGQPPPEGIDPSTSVVLLWPKGSTIVMGTGAPQAVLEGVMTKIIRGEYQLQS